MQDLQNKLNITEVHLTTNFAGNEEKVIVESALHLMKSLNTSLISQSKEWITVFEKNIRKAPTLSYFIRQVSNVMPATNIYRQIMFNVLHENHNLTFYGLQQLSSMNTSAIDPTLGEIYYIAKLQLNSQLDLHFKSIQLLQELSWSYALYLVFTTTTTHPPPTSILF